MSTGGCPVKAVRLIIVSTFVGLGLTSAPASAGKGLGELYNLKYESAGISQRNLSPDARVELSVEDINTINCGGCEITWMGPGVVFHLRNLTKKPVCARWNFTRSNPNWEINHFGSGSIHLIKGGKTAAKVGGVYHVSSGDERTMDIGFQGSLVTWDPIAKNDCGAGPG